MSYRCGLCGRHTTPDESVEGAVPRRVVDFGGLTGPITINQVVRLCPDCRMFGRIRRDPRGSRVPSRASRTIRVLSLGAGVGAAAPTTQGGPRSILTVVPRMFGEKEPNLQWSNATRVAEGRAGG